MTDLLYAVAQKPPPPAGASGSGVRGASRAANSPSFEEVLARETSEEPEPKEPAGTDAPTGMAVLPVPTQPVQSPPPPEEPTGMDGSTQPVAGNSTAPSGAQPGTPTAPAGEATAAMAQELLGQLVSDGPNAAPALAPDGGQVPQLAVADEAVAEAAPLADVSPMEVAAPKPMAAKPAVGDLEANPFQIQQAQRQATETQAEPVRAESAARPAETSQTTTDANPVSGLETAAVRTTPATTPLAEPARLAEARAATLIRQIAPHVEGAVRQGQTTVRLQLNPDELGHIDLRLTASAGGLRVTMIADQTATARMLEEQLHQLRQTLSNAGIELANLQVSAEGHPRPDAQAGWQANQSAQRGHTNRTGSQIADDAPSSSGQFPQSRGISPYGVDYRI